MGAGAPIRLPFVVDSFPGHAEAGIIQISATIGVDNPLHLSENAADRLDFTAFQKAAHELTDSGTDDRPDAPPAEQIQSLINGQFSDGDFLPAHFEAILQIDAQEFSAGIENRRNTRLEYGDCHSFHDVSRG
jgi:hypothetical protein